MNALTFTIKLMEPLLIGNPVSGDENSATGLDFIPGSVIRGALAQAFTKGKRGDLSDVHFSRLFFGDVYFLNAYLVIDNARSLPTPLSWHRNKDAGEDDPVLDLANRHAPEEPLKRLSKPFVHIQPAFPRMEEDESGGDSNNAEGVDTPTAIVSEPERHISVHVLQQDRRNAVRSGTGTVFRYDALAAGQHFSGAILSDADDDLRELKTLLDGASFKLGKSRSAGYGAVRVADTKVVADWRECAPSLSTGAIANARVLVTLLSDAIIRDVRTGACSASLDAEFMESFARTHIIGGFNLAWGLPMPQARAIQAGSVFVFERTDAVMVQLRTAEQSGIGERRIDGFGRIAVDWHTAPQVSVAPADRASRLDNVKLTVGSPERNLAQQMANRIWRAQLDAALRDAIGKSKMPYPPSNAQLSRLRTLVREAWRAKDATLISEVLKEPDKEGNNRKAMKRHAREQFDKARISINDTSPLLIWLSALANTPSAVWNELGTSGLARPTIGGAEAEDPSALEYAARLIDGVLRKAAKEGAD